MGKKQKSKVRQAAKPTKPGAPYSAASKSKPNIVAKPGRTLRSGPARGK